jgi:hypothetical protein
MPVSSPPLPSESPVLRRLLDELRRDPDAAAVLRRELAVDAANELVPAGVFAESYQRSAKTVERWCRTGRIPEARKIGRGWMIPLGADVLPAPTGQLGDPGAPGRRGGRTPHTADQAGRDVVAAMRARTKGAAGGRRIREAA